MSKEEAKIDHPMSLLRCALCNAAGVDDEDCLVCKLAKCLTFASIQKGIEKNRPQPGACDEILFKQPEGTHLGDCPICYVPISPNPNDQRKSIMFVCCSNMICNGCVYACLKKEREGELESKCPFCRHPTDSDSLKNDRQKLKKRVEANDPVGWREMGKRYDKEENFDKAFECYTKAAELGDAEAHYSLTIMYHNGEGVAKDDKKKFYHSEKAAILGHPLARYNLGCDERKYGNMDRAVKHWIIAANQGEDNSLECLKNLYRKGDGLVSKEMFASALRAHQAAVDATKSPQRKETEQFW